MTQPATVGSHLLYTYQASDHCKKQAIGQSRPAIVVRSWGTCYNVQVLTDGVNDFDDKRTVLHLTSIAISDCIAKGRLHWAGSPLEAEPVAPAEEPAPLLVDGVPYAVGDLPAGEPAPAEAEPVQTTVAPPSAPKKSNGGRPKKSK